MKQLEKLEKGLAAVELAVMTVIFLGIFVVLVLQVVFRYCLNTPLGWSEEFARYSFTWICMIGVGYLVMKDTHIRMELIYNRFPPALRRVVSLVIYGVVLAAFLYLLPPSIRQMIKRGATKSSAMRLPMSVLYGAFPVCCILTSIHVVMRILRLLFKREVTD